MFFLKKWFYVVVDSKSLGVTLLRKKGDKVQVYLPVFGWALERRPTAKDILIFSKGEIVVRED